MQIKNIILLMEEFDLEHKEKFKKLILKWHPDKSKGNHNIAATLNNIKDLPKEQANKLLDTAIEALSSDNPSEEIEKLNNVVKREQRNIVNNQKSNHSNNRKQEDKNGNETKEKRWREEVKKKTEEKRREKRREEIKKEREERKETREEWRKARKKRKEKNIKRKEKK